MACKIKKLMRKSSNIFLAESNMLNIDLGFMGNETLVQYSYFTHNHGPTVSQMNFT